jgi:hypothetical protein
MRLERFISYQIAHVKCLPNAPGDDLIFIMLERSGTSILQLDPAIYDQFSEIFAGIDPSKAPSATAWIIDDEGPRCLRSQWVPIFDRYPVLLQLAPSEVQRLYQEEKSRRLPILIYRDRFSATYSLPSLSSPRLRSEWQRATQVCSHRYRSRTLSNSDRRARSPLRQTVAKGTEDSVSVRTRAQARSQRAADIGSSENSDPADRADEDVESDSEVEPAPTTGKRKRVNEQETTEASRPRKKVKKARNATAPAPAPVTQPAQLVPVPQPVVVPLHAGPQAAGPPPAVPQPAAIPQPAAASQTAAVPQPPPVRPFDSSTPKYRAVPGPGPQKFAWSQGHINSWLIANPGMQLPARANNIDVSPVHTVCAPVSVDVKLLGDIDVSIVEVLTVCFRCPLRYCIHVNEKI